MALDRHHLPIASPCNAFVGTEATDDVPAFCTRCDQSVHDLSRLTEDDIVDLLARHVGRRVCVSYQVRADGRVVTRKPPSWLATASLSLSLAACAGHVTDHDRVAQPECLDDDGYLGGCPRPPRLADAVIPEQPAVIEEPPQMANEEEPIDEAQDASAASVVAEVVEHLEFTRGWVSAAPEPSAGLPDDAVQAVPLGEYVPTGEFGQRVMHRHEALGRAERRAAKRAARIARRRGVAG